MEESHSFGGLPEAYANALLLRDRGVPAERIAAILDIPGESIGSLMRLGEAKLDHLLTETVSPATRRRNRCAD